MTRLASYEQREGRHDSPARRYYRSDYIGVQILWSVIGITVAFVAVAAVFILCSLQDLLADFYELDLIGMVRTAARYYAVTVCSYIAITYVVYAYRYHKAGHGQSSYRSGLARLQAMLRESSQ